MQLTDIHGLIRSWYVSANWLQQPMQRWLLSFICIIHICFKQIKQNLQIL